MNIELNISNKGLNCLNVVKTLLKCNIEANVTQNVSTICNPKKCWLENGCTIKTTLKNKEEIKNLWHTLEYKYQLNCAHLNVNNEYNGCIKKYF